LKAAITVYGKQKSVAGALASIIEACLCYAPSATAREEFLGRMSELLAVPAVATWAEEATLPLNWEPVREMQDSGLISF
jgi:hypothetical protein